MTSTPNSPMNTSVANDTSVPAPVRPTAFPSGSGGGVDEDIPPEIFDQIRESEIASGGGGVHRGSGSANTALSKTLTMGQTVRSAVFHCDDLGNLGESPLELATYNVYHNVQYTMPVGDSSCSMGRTGRPAV